MTPNLQTLTSIRVEVLKGISALWKRTDCREAYESLGICIDLLNANDLSNLQLIRSALEDAHGELLGQSNVSEALGCIRRAALAVQTATQQKAQVGTLGRFVA